MISYTLRQGDIITPEEATLLLRAQQIVAWMPDLPDPGIRCHELARIVGHILKLPVQDGHFGSCDHTWLWTKAVDAEWINWDRPNIIDVYSVGTLPQVALHVSGHCLPHLHCYHIGAERTDINHALVEKYVQAWRDSHPAQ